MKTPLQLDLAKANQQLTRWLRKQKLANTKVRLYANELRRLMNRQEKQQQQPTRKFDFT